MARRRSASRPVADTRYDEIVARIRQGDGRVTGPRRVIIATLLGADSHVTAEDLAEQVHRQLPEVHLSTVYRTGQRFGAGHLIDVLRGKATERVKSFGHDRLKTFDLGKDLDDKRWRSVFRQLVATGLLRVDVTGYGALMLTQTARPVLRGEQAVHFRREVEVEKKKTAQTRNAVPLDMPEDRRELLAALRTLRRKLAEEHGVPSFVIFHDSTLLQLVMQRPRNRAQLAKISGIGTQKLERYGAALLDVLRTHAA